ncbi:hypothetical protein BURPS1710A_A0466 [Burkholderia pseudomallei 1710a]|uniref:Uncharacterized protein n=1 Tax=Burkholderia pseudomallei 1710a TaxID=320371 RepID=A0A0E1VRX4_BURPE|nr:hypothetical protein BURPS1710A_A0466 [Burkholderia pseudomallei 1710a]
MAVGVSSAKRVSTVWTKAGGMDACVSWLSILMKVTSI